ncbi:MAG: endopeptidase La [Candidatus Eisenbacteria bacterium]|uniref:Lon protease n=1 Tax=Eiseniibacteriota bacterium TaxID=2212470 RepID=A0A956NCZ8_UNCEI|nr:endopeptidase La [Candidatus Eisenbacteria bacterium]MCB9464837.1 endopeptidase La [Candidatus Eisenbacteria bacterium]
MTLRITVDGREIRVPNRLPLLPLRDVVIFPGVTLPLFVGRSASVAAIEEAEKAHKVVFASAQIRPDVSEPGEQDLHRTGTIVRILQVFRLPDGTMRILVEGLARAALSRLESQGNGLFGSVRLRVERQGEELIAKSHLTRAQALFTEFAELSGRVPDELRSSVVDGHDAHAVSYLIASQVLVSVASRQELLESDDSIARLETLRRALTKENATFRRRKVEASSSSAPSIPIPRTPHKETDPDKEGMAEIEEFERLVRSARMPQSVEKKALQEVDRLARMPVFSPEATVTRGYLTWLTGVPWNKKTRDRRNLIEAEEILDADHFGLTRVKERILEHIAVVQLTKSVRGPVLCLVGPPGVGKTSLGRSVARALGRKFARIALGGVRDEAEIRGHRRTYIGSMPGRIAQAMKKVGTVNPVILLDEVDKLSSDYRGDPSAALLEVLDPEQNHGFSDHYLEVDYDLSKVLFLTTANDANNIPIPLLDRMELIRLPGYLESEKLEIADRFLLPRQRTATGLSEDDLVVPRDTLLRIVREYTREAGVRSLEREIGSVCRKIARQKASKTLDGARTVGAEELPDLLGPERFLSDGPLERAGRVGVSTGLAWTETGGEILLIEVRALPGNGQLILTGKLGETMRESARAAVSWVRSECATYDIDPSLFASHDLHVHVPQGAVPKDGPSAGAAIALAIISALTERSTRSTVALTGEITLRGRVLPIGGLTEKAVAAHRYGVRTLLVPEGNRRHVSEIPAEIREELEIILVSQMSEVVRRGLARANRSGGKRRKVADDLYAA